MAIYLSSFSVTGPEKRMDGTTSDTFSAGNDARFTTYIEQSNLRSGGLHGPLATGTLLLISGTAYFVFLGRVATAFVPAYVKGMCGTIGAGSQTAELGLFSTPLPPNGSSQSVTKIEATGTITSLTSTGVKQNTSAFSTSVAAGTYLWAGMRTAMGTTQPTMQAYLRDYARGNLLSTAASGVLTGTGPWTGATIAATAATSEAPYLWWALDA